MNNYPTVSKHARTQQRHCELPIESKMKTKSSTQTRLYCNMRNRAGASQQEDTSLSSWCERDSLELSTTYRLAMGMRHVPAETLTAND